MNEAPASTTPDPSVGAPPLPVADADLPFDQWIEKQAGKPATATPDTPAEETPPVDSAVTEPAAETPPADAAATSEPEAEPEPDPASEAGRTLARHKGSLQARIDQAIAKQRDAERRAEELQREIAALRGTPPPAAAPAPVAEAPKYATPADDPKPSIADFQDAEDPYAAHNEATARWAARDEHRRLQFEAGQKAAAERARIDAETAHRQTEQAVAEHLSRIDAFRQTHPDFDAVLANPDAVMNPWIHQEIAERGDGPAIAYYLGKNPQESRRLAGLSSQKAVIREIGTIASRLGAASSSGPAASTVPTNSAPRPPKPVGASATQLPRDPASMGTDEYIEWAQKNDPARQRRG